MVHHNPGVAVWLKVVVVLAAFTTNVMSQNTLFPSIPASQEDSPLANLWQHALRNEQVSTGQSALRGDETAPKTYVAPEYIEVINWVPQDSAHPLYATEFSDLLKQILLDYMVQEEVKPDDPRMSQPDGLQVTNLNGKTLTFTKDASGVAVWLKVVVVLAAFTTTVMSQNALFPSIPASQEDLPLANLWRHALRQQKDANGQPLTSEKPCPSTYVSPTFSEVMNWVPQDSRHPLYLPEYLYLLREILFDAMVTEVVKPDDPRMSQPGGLQVTTYNGKTLTFTRDASGIKVDGVLVVESKYETHSDGTVSYILDKSLFDHKAKVHQAWLAVQATGPRLGPYGRPPMQAPPLP